MTGWLVFAKIKDWQSQSTRKGQYYILANFSRKDERTYLTSTSPSRFMVGGEARVDDSIACSDQTGVLENIRIIFKENSKFYE